MTGFTKWNPICGCTPVDPGCDNCPGKRAAWRQLCRNDLQIMDRVRYEVAVHEGRWTGRNAFFPDRLDQPLRWRKPRHVLIGTMGDPFHHNVQDDWLDRIFAVMALCPQHTFLIRTKRPERLTDYTNYFEPIFPHDRSDKIGILMNEREGKQYRNPRLDCRLPLPNVAIGVLIHDQSSADELVPKLLEVPAAKLFIWVRPRGPVDLAAIRYSFPTAKCDGTPCEWFDANSLHGISMVICEGERGPNAHPCHPDWVRSLRDQCAAAGVAFNFRGWWRYASVRWQGTNTKEGDYFAFGDGTIKKVSSSGQFAVDTRNLELLRSMSAKEAGRLLDGVVHDGWPE